MQFGQFQLFAISNEEQQLKTAKLLAGKTLINELNAFFVNFGVFQRESIRNDLVYQPQIFRDN